MEWRELPAVLFLSTFLCATFAPLTLAQTLTGLGFSLLRSLNAQRFALGILGLNKSQNFCIHVYDSSVIAERLVG